MAAPFKLLFFFHQLCVYQVRNNPKKKKTMPFSPAQRDSRTYLHASYFFFYYVEDSSNLSVHPFTASCIESQWLYVTLCGCVAKPYINFFFFCLHAVRVQAKKNQQKFFEIEKKITFLEVRKVVYWKLRLFFSLSEELSQPKRNKFGGGCYSFGFYDITVLFRVEI